MKAMREITLSEQELEAIGRHVILQESDAVRGLAEQVDSHFSRAVRVPVSYTHLTLPTIRHRCRSRWSPYH